MQKDTAKNYIQSARVITEGGRLSVRQMTLILQAAQDADLTYMRIDARQSLIFNTGALPTRAEQIQLFAEQLANAGLRCAGEDEQNIVSSLPGAQVFAKTSWVDTGVYGVLLRELNELGIGGGTEPGQKLTEPLPAFPLSVCLIDGCQHLIPHFGSELNLIASETEDYWYVYIRYGAKQPFPVLWPFLIGSPCLAQFVHSLAHDLAAGMEVYTCAEQYALNARWQMIALEHGVEPLHAAVPRYEGFIPYGQNQYALGIVRADQSFDLLMVEQMLKLMHQQNLSDVYMTSWGSLLIKEIHEENIPVWNRLLCLHHCDVGLSYGQLNWLIQTDEAIHATSLQLRNRLAQQLQDNGLRTWGLTFAIVNADVRKSTSFPASAIVQIQRDSSWLGWRKRVRYALWNTDSEPSVAQKYTCIAENLDEGELTELLIETVIRYQKSIGLGRKKTFFSPLSMPLRRVSSNPAVHTESLIRETKVHRGVFACRYCATEYHENLGEPSQNIAAHTLFTELGESFHCPVCEHGKSAFEPLLRSA